LSRFITYQNLILPRFISTTFLRKSIRIAIEQAIALIPDAYTSQNLERDRLLSIVKATNGNLSVIGNEVVKYQTLFNFSK